MNGMLAAAGLAESSLQHEQQLILMCFAILLSALTLVYLLAAAIYIVVRQEQSKVWAAIIALPLLEYACFLLSWLYWPWYCEGLHAIGFEDGRHAVADEHCLLFTTVVIGSMILNVILLFIRHTWAPDEPE